MARLGAYNIHPSYLPDYKGAKALSRALNDKKEYTGITLHKMNDRFDDGEILFQHKIPIIENDTFDTLYERFIDLIPVVLDELNDSFKEG